jgi:hypothetical protein
VANVEVGRLSTHGAVEDAVLDLLDDAPSVATAA